MARQVTAIELAGETLASQQCSRARKLADPLQGKLDRLNSSTVLGKTGVAPSLCASERDQYVGGRSRAGFSTTQTLTDQWCYVHIETGVQPSRSPVR